MNRPHRTLLAVLATLAVAGPVSVSAPADAASPGRAGPVVAVNRTNSPFSPNGDGSKDRGAVSYRLAKRAYVTVTIKGTGGATVLTTHVGRAKKGNHTYVWDGKRAGRVVRDGAYTITVLSRATKHGPARAARTRLVVDARYGSKFSGTLPLSSDTVYPRTTVIHDEVVGSGISFSGYDPATVRRQVLTPSGRLVDSARLNPCSTECGQRQYSWDGRDSNGAVVPAGTYRIGLTLGRDRAGNPRLLLPLRTVRVSTQRLVAKTTNVSAAAQTFARREPCYHGPNDCFVGQGTASARFPGGVAYTSHQITFDGNTFYDSERDHYVLPVTGRSTPYDTFTVTAHGGPTTEGDDDTGTLDAYVVSDAGATGQRSATLQGDTIGRLTRVPSLGMRDTYLKEDGGTAGQVLLWTFGTGNGNSYDVASFDVSYTRFVLP